MVRLQASYCVMMLLTASSCWRGSSRRLGTPHDQRDKDHADGHEDYKQRRSLDHYDSKTLADMFNGDKFAPINWWTGEKMGGDDETTEEDPTQSFQEDDIDTKVFEPGSTSWWTPVEPPTDQNTPPPPPPPTAPVPRAPVPPPRAPVPPPTAPVTVIWLSPRPPAVSTPTVPVAPVSPPTAPVPPPSRPTTPTAPVAPVSPPTAPVPAPTPPTGIKVNSWWADQVPVAPPPVPPSVAAKEDGFTGDAAAPVSPPMTAPVAAPPPPPNNFPGSSTLTIVGDNDDIIGRCEGDCDSDSNCSGGMVCYQREGSLTSVPGCFGDPGGRDYCIDPQDNPSNIHKDTFRLKLFWREGYLWQEENFERLWCMDCYGTRCDVGENVKVSECDGSNTEFQFINEADNAAQIYIPANDKCLEARIGEMNLKVAECDNSDSAQRFWAGPDGSFHGDRFELIPLSVTQLDECMTQRHHPKEGEVVYREMCETARNDKTNYWNRY